MRFDGASVSKEVKSHKHACPLSHGMRVMPSGLLTSSWQTPTGSSIDGTPPDIEARWKVSFSAWCMLRYSPMHHFFYSWAHEYPFYPLLLLRHISELPPSQQTNGNSKRIVMPRCDRGRALSQVPASLMAVDNRWARVTGSVLESRRSWWIFSVKTWSHTFCLPLHYSKGRSLSACSCQRSTASSTSTPLLSTTETSREATSCSVPCVDARKAGRERSEACWIYIPRPPKDAGLVA